MAAWLTLQRLRFLANLTQAELAAQVGITESAISHLEAGRRGASTATLHRLAKTLNTDVEALRQSMPIPPAQKRHIKPGDAA